MPNEQQEWLEEQLAKLLGLALKPVLIHAVTLHLLDTLPSSPQGLATKQMAEAGDAMYRALAYALQADPDDDAEIADLIGGGAHTLRDWKAARKAGP